MCDITDTLSRTNLSWKKLQIIPTLNDCTQRQTPVAMGGIAVSYPRFRSPLLSKHILNLGYVHADPRRFAIDFSFVSLVRMVQDLNDVDCFSEVVSTKSKVNKSKLNFLIFNEILCCLLTSSNQSHPIDEQRVAFSSARIRKPANPSWASKESLKRHRS